MEKPDEKIDQENIENGNEKKEKENLELRAFFDLIKETLKDINFENILESSNKVKIEKIHAEKTQGNRNLTFWKWKFIKEFSIILIILISVVGLSFSDKIESSTIGTLFGSIIGYAIGNFGSKEQKS